MKFFIHFLGVLGYTGHFKRPFLSCDLWSAASRSSSVTVCVHPCVRGWVDIMLLPTLTDFLIMGSTQDISRLP